MNMPNYNAGPIIRAVVLPVCDKNEDADGEKLAGGDGMKMDGRRP